MSGPNRDLVSDLLVPVSRSELVSEVQSVLLVTRRQASEIVEAFDVFVAQPMERNLAAFRGRDMPKRNPMIYIVRGVRTVGDWVDRVVAERETSAIEGHLGTFLEEVARIVSGGVKPGSGIDLQVEGDDGTVQLYAIQSAPNTKNSGAKRSDIDALKRAARPL